MRGPSPAGGGSHGGRGAEDGRHSLGHRGRRPAPGAAPGEVPGRLLAIPLPPLPDVRAGDDLVTLIADALRAGAAADPELAPAPATCWW